MSEPGLPFGVVCVVRLEVALVRYEPEWAVYRVMFDDGSLLNIEAVRDDSNMRRFAVDEQARLQGKADRKIIAVAVLDVKVTS